MNLSTFRPTFRSIVSSKSSLARPALAKPQHGSLPASAPTASFSSTTRMQKRAAKSKTDPRITNIRYHLSHPLTPRPLHFSRTRALRHWTIHRAWQLFQRKQRTATSLELERQYESMRAACEHLRLLDENGMRVSEAEAGGQGPDTGRLGVKGKEVGRLYRGAMIKRGVWGSVPVEYARGQVDFPGREGWNHEWTR